MPATTNSIRPYPNFRLTIETMRLKVKHFLPAFLLSLSSLSATPTSLFWTNCTTDAVAQGKYHIDVDNYFSVGNRTKNGSSFPPDLGVVAGLPTYKGLGGEVGIDYLGGVSDPLYFNGKLALQESSLFAHSPSMSIGVFNVGTTHSTNQSVFDFVIGTTLPKELGRLFAGLYHGKRAIGKHRSGFMLGYQKGFWHKKEENGTEYDKWQFYADYASQKNAIGGGGFALAYYFNQAISLESGPVWFNDTKLNGRWKWSVQVGIDF